MRISCHTYSLPKTGREFVDYEDAYFPCNPARLESFGEEVADLDFYRTAVCDGATDSCFSKFWAELLAVGYGTGELSEDLSPEMLKRPQQIWKDYLAQQELPWYAEEKAKLGAFAAFVGLTIHDHNKWNAIAVGDSCLFHTRNAELIESFPIATSAEFNNFPYLLASLAPRNENVFAHKAIRSDGAWQAGDMFFLMSDAISCWFLRHVEQGAGNEAIRYLADMGTRDQFVEMVVQQRKEHGADGLPKMRDDDVTFVKIVIDGSAATQLARPKQNALDDKVGRATKPLPVQPPSSVKPEAREAAPPKTATTAAANSSYGMSTKARNGWIGLGIAAALCVAGAAGSMINQHHDQKHGDLIKKANQGTKGGQSVKQSQSAKNDETQAGGAKRKSKHEAAVAGARHHDTSGSARPAAGGHDTPIAGGHDTPITGGHDSPVIGGHDSPVIGGRDTPVGGGHDGPVRGGHNTTLPEAVGVPAMLPSSITRGPGNHISSTTRTPSIVRNQGRTNQGVHAAKSDSGGASAAPGHSGATPVGRQASGNSATAVPGGSSVPQGGASAAASGAAAGGPTAPGATAGTAPRGGSSPMAPVPGGGSPSGSAATPGNGSVPATGPATVTDVSSTGDTASHHVSTAPRHGGGTSSSGGIHEEAQAQRTKQPLRPHRQQGTQLPAYLGKPVGADDADQPNIKLKNSSELGDRH